MNAVTAAYQKDMAALRADLQKTNSFLNVAESGEIPPDQFLIARELIGVEWAKNQYGQRRNCDEVQIALLDAIEELRHGGGKLHRQYIGIKEYDRWAAQRTDCEYGYGPRHGSIWFRIGLHHPAGGPLDDDQRLACIAWLNALKKDPSLLDRAGL